MALSKYDIEADLVSRQGTSHAHIVDLVGSNKRVLDVGCDTGYLGEALAALGNTVSGVEFNPVTAREAERKLKSVVTGDVETLDLVGEFGPGSFDVIVYGDVLEHLRDPLPVLRAARPLLAPGGSVIISTPNVAHGDVRLALLAGKFNYTKLGILDETHTRFFTRDSLMRFVEDAGLVTTEIRRTFAPLFGTEQDLRLEDYAPDVVASLEADVEAKTYQFVLRAVAADAVTYGSQTARDLDETRNELASARVELSKVQAALGAAEQEVHGLSERLLDRDSALESVVSELASVRADLSEQIAVRDAQIEAFHQSRTARAIRFTRRMRGL